MSFLLKGDSMRALLGALVVATLIVPVGEPPAGQPATPAAPPVR